MKKASIVALVAASLLLPAAIARADCSYDIGQLKAKLATEPDKVKAAAVRKQLDKAAEAQRTSETECRNAVTRGWRALRAPPEEPARAPNTANVPNYSGPTYNTPHYNGQNYGTQY
jgi:hypothetical protein